MKCAFGRVTTVSVRLLPSEMNIQISQEMPTKNPATPTQRTQSRTGEAAQKNQLGLQIHAAVDGRRGVLQTLQRGDWSFAGHCPIDMGCRPYGQEERG